MNASIIRLAQDGLAIKAITRQTGCSRKTVRQILRGERSDVFRCRTSSLEPYLVQLDASGVLEAATVPSSGDG
jgi:predicted transcriptional regulator